MKVGLSAIAIVMFLGVHPARGAELKVGDPAPPLTIRSWVNGESIDPASAKGDQVLVLVFWMSWHQESLEIVDPLKEIADYFRRGRVRFILVTSESPRRLELHLKEPGAAEKLPYTFASDDSRKTTLAWQVAANRPPPVAFVVQGGTIRWLGHPTFEDMGGAIAGLIGDSGYAAFKAKFDSRRQRLKQLAETIDAEAKRADWETTLSAVTEYLAESPENSAYQVAKYHLLLARLNRPDAAREWGRRMLNEAKDPDALDGLAGNILKQRTPDLELARAAAEKAVRLTDASWPPYMDTLAAVAAASGDWAAAVQWETKALTSCDDYLMKRELSARLEEFKQRAASMP